MNNKVEMAAIVRDALLELIRPVQLLTLNPEKASGKVSGRFRSGKMIFDYEINPAKEEILYKPLRDGAQKARSDGRMDRHRLLPHTGITLAPAMPDEDARLDAMVESLRGGDATSWAYLQGLTGWSAERLDALHDAEARMDAGKGGARTAQGKNCGVGYGCGSTCISKTKDCRVRSVNGEHHQRLLALMGKEFTDPGNPKAAMVRGAGGGPVQITSKNVKEYAGGADVSALKGKTSLGHVMSMFDVDGEMSKGGEWAMVGINKLVSPKNELEDPKLLAGKKNDPRTTAANAMAWTADGDPRSKGKRAFLNVSDNGDGTYTVLDGNATFQAAALAGIKQLPIRVVAKRGWGLELVANKAAGEEYSPGARKLAPAVYRKALRKQKAISKTVMALAEKHGAELEGLSYRVKTENSIASKIDRDTSEMREKLMKTRAGRAMTPAQRLSAAQKMAADGMADTIRFTMLSDGGYTPKTAKVLDDLKASGHKLRIKNSWEEGQAYRGMNVAVTAPDGTGFEIQFHSAGSKKLAKEIHGIYNVYRESKDDKQRMKLHDQMMRFSSKMQAPYTAPGTGGAPASSIADRRKLLGLGDRKFRGYQSTAEAFPGEQSTSSRRSTLQNPRPDLTSRRRKRSPA